MYMFLKDRNTISNVHQNPIFLAEHLGNNSCDASQSVQPLYIVPFSKIRKVKICFDNVQFFEDLRLLYL